MFTYDRVNLNIDSEKNELWLTSQVFSVLERTETFTMTFNQVALMLTNVNLQKLVWKTVTTNMFLKAKCYSKVFEASNWLSDAQSYHVSVLWCMTTLLQAMMGWKFEEMECKRFSFQKGFLWFRSLSMAGHQQPWKKAHHILLVSWTVDSNCR